MKRRKFGFILSGFLVLALALGFGVGGGVQKANAFDPYWQLVSSPNKGTGFNTLNGVYESSSSDVWSVGYYLTTGSVAQTLTEHYDGTSWSIVDSPNQGSGNNYLNSVSYARSSLLPGNVWAVGYYVNSSSKKQALIEKYNGSSWSDASPTVDSSHDNVLNSVVSISASNAWAVGYYYDSSTRLKNTPLIMHWNGSNWTQATNPSLTSGDDYYLNGVSAADSSDVWAVGYKNDGSTNAAVLFEWNGSSWSDDSTSLPNPSISDPTLLLGVSMLTGTDVWMTGTDYGSLFIVPWAVHHDSSGWHESVFGPSENFPSVDDIASNSAWVGGFGPSGCCTRMLGEYWDGSGWTAEAGVGGNGFNSINGLSLFDTWGVGDDGSYTVIEHFINS